MHSTLKNIPHVSLLLFPHNEGKGNSVSEADQQSFTKACNRMRLSKENVRYLLEKGNKEMTIEVTLAVP